MKVPQWSAVHVRRRGWRQRLSDGKSTHARRTDNALCTAIAVCYADPTCRRMCSTAVLVGCVAEVSSAVRVLGSRAGRVTAVQNRTRAAAADDLKVNRTVSCADNKWCRVAASSKPQTTRQRWRSDRLASPLGEFCYEAIAKQHDTVRLFACRNGWSNNLSKAR